MEPLTLGIIAVVVILLVTIAFILVPYLKNKGLLNEQNTQAANQVLSLIGLVLSNINIGNDKVKSEAETIFNITQKVVQYVEQTMDADGASKKQAALEAAKDILAKLNIELTPDNEKLIEVGIESAVSVLPKTNTQ